MVSTSYSLTAPLDGRRVDDRSADDVHPIGQAQQVEVGEARLVAKDRGDNGASIDGAHSPATSRRNPPAPVIRTLLSRQNVDASSSTHRDHVSDVAEAHLRLGLGQESGQRRRPGSSAGRREVMTTCKASVAGEESSRRIAPTAADTRAVPSRGASAPSFPGCATDRRSRSRRPGSPPRPGAGGGVVGS